MRQQKSAISTSKQAKQPPAVRGEPEQVATAEGVARLKRNKPGPYFHKHHRFVCRICSPVLSRRARINLIDSASNQQIYAISECIRNTVNRVLPISPKVKAKLIPHKRPLLKLASSKKQLDVASRKKILTQLGSGIFLPLIASAVVSYLLDKVKSST